MSGSAAFNLPLHPEGSAGLQHRFTLADIHDEFKAKSRQGCHLVDPRKLG